MAIEELTQEDELLIMTRKYADEIEKDYIIARSIHPRMKQEDLPFKWVNIGFDPEDMGCTHTSVYFAGHKGEIFLIENQHFKEPQRKILEGYIERVKNIFPEINPYKIKKPQ